MDATWARLRELGELFSRHARSYLRARPDGRFVLIILGDHQPAANVSGEGASWDVPVHVIASEPAMLQALQADGFRPGLTPARPTAGKMSELGPWALAAFGQAAQGRRARLALTEDVHAMSGFAPDWLALREPLDAASRCVRLGGLALAVLARGRGAAAGVEVIDLGAGTGANLRYVAPLIACRTELAAGGERSAAAGGRGRAACILGAQGRLPACSFCLGSCDPAAAAAAAGRHFAHRVGAARPGLGGRGCGRSSQALTAVAAIVWFALTYDGAHRVRATGA